MDLRMLTPVPDAQKGDLPSLVISCSLQLVALERLGSEKKVCEGGWAGVRGSGSEAGE